MSKNKIFRQVLLALLCLMIQDFSFAQDRFPDPGFLYDSSSLARVDIAIAADSLSFILSPGNEESDHEFMATFKFTRGNISETIDSVGFRLRGNTSRYSYKKSFKVSLNTFIQGQKFHGVEKINLNGEHNDPSMSRAALSWYLFRKAGVPAPRASHVMLYINDEFRGVYLNVEHIDDEFVDLHFGNREGNLYKCLYPADLAYLGSSPERYKLAPYGGRSYDLKTNEDEDDYSDLAEFISLLNNTYSGNFPVELERIFNVNTYLKNMAVEVLIGHWDAYSFNKNNYYLYHNAGTGKFEFIPYDPDNTFGISWFDDDWSERDLYAWYKENEDRPLMKKILLNETYRNRYSFYMYRLLESYYNSGHLDPLLDGFRAKIGSPAAVDLYRTYDYGYTYSDFYNSFESAAGAHVRLGIREFISVRSQSALEQLDLQAIDPVITLLSVNRPELMEAAEIEFLVEDDVSVDEVKIWFSTGGEFSEWIFADKGNGLYTSRHPGLTEDGILKFYIEARDNEQNLSRDPVQGYYSIPYGNATLDSGRGKTYAKTSLYPNPASTYLVISSPRQFRSYQIIDISGKVVQEGLVESATKIILEEHLRNGLYLLRLMQGDAGSAAAGSVRFMINR